MNKLQKSDGTFTANQKEILEGQTEFYSDLYKSKSTISKSAILTIDECYDTLKTFSANKTPGNDGCL